MKQPAVNKLNPKIKYKISPLDYMMSVINDPKASTERKDRMAVEVSKYLFEKIPQKIDHKRDASGTPTSKEAKKQKAPKPLGKKEQLNVSAKTAHKKNEWGNDLQQ